jgi:hypothetical protein
MRKSTGVLSTVCRPGKQSIPVPYSRILANESSSVAALGDLVTVKVGAQHLEYRVHSALLAHYSEVYIGGAPMEDIDPETCKWVLS